MEQRISLGSVEAGSVEAGSAEAGKMDAELGKERGSRKWKVERQRSREGEADSRECGGRERACRKWYVEMQSSREGGSRK